MLAGRLRDRITILKRERITGPFGTSEEWKSVDTRWGRMAPMRVSSRAAYAQAINTDVTHHVTFRHSLHITPEDYRIEWRGQQYEVIEQSMDSNISGTVWHVAVRLLP